MADTVSETHPSRRRSGDLAEHKDPISETPPSMGEGLRPSPSRRRSGDLAEHKDPVPEIHTEREAPENLTEGEVELVLNYLLSHKKAFSQDFLRDRGLPFSGTKEKLRERLKEYLSDGQLDAADLVWLLNRIEGWGNQHIYLYQASDRLIEPWLEEDSVRKRLADLGLADLFNRQRPLVLPEETTLSSIEWTPERVRFVWVEKRQWEERVSEEDIEEEGMVWRAYRINVSRSLIAFDWDLVSGYAMLMIQRLPRGTKYYLIRDRFEKELEPMVGLSQFEQVRVSRAIQRIQASEEKEVRRRQLAYQTQRGGKVTFTSAGRSRGTSADPDLKRAGQALSSTAGLLGNFYWIPVEGKPGCEVHSKLYASDQRVGIFGEHEERDVRYVLSRIRQHCI
jgi:hypothetical protein